MPCPLFEPLRMAAKPYAPDARLPLLAEFEGICHAGGGAEQPSHRFQFCNRGYAKGNCPNFPSDYPVSAVQFNVIARADTNLSIAIIEEQDHWPLKWRTIEFHSADGSLCPEIEDVCTRAQAIYFCRTYLARASGAEN
jgi:hypothetical protein